VICSIACTGAFAQSVTTSYSTDLNGNRVAGPSIVSDGTQKTQIMQSINGRKVPLEQSEERVIREGPGGKVVERITKKFDLNGQLASTERTVTEEEKLSDGTRAHSVIYRSDLDGQMHEAERRNVELHIQGSSSSTQTEVARPDLNGSFQAVEKRSVSTQTSGKSTQSDETVYRRSGSGEFYPAVREVSESTTNGSQVVEKSAHYEPRDSQQLQLTAQTVTTTTKRADGSSVSEVNLYGLSSEDGRARDRQSGPQLREQQTVEKIAGPGGSVTEIVTARRPTVADPSHLGPSVKVSESVCTGKCTNVGVIH
jgi:hypothetical protein